MNTTDTTQTALPELSDHQIARMEKHIFQEIGVTAPRARARRTWLIGLSVAAAFAVGALISPIALDSLRNSASSNAADAGAPEMYAYDGAIQEAAASAADSAVMPLEAPQERVATDEAGMKSLDAVDLAGDATAMSDVARDIVKSANLTLEVAKIRDAAEQIESKVSVLGGIVQNVSIGTDPGRYLPQPRPVDSASSVEAEVPDTYGHLMVRVPAEQLDSFLKDIGSLGTVTSSTVSTDDQTVWGTEIRSQAAASEASLAKLNELMSQATDLSDVISLEQAITERQATLDWQKQMVNDLESRVEMSEVYIDLRTPPAPATVDKHGFVDGIKAGWNGFVASLNAVVIAAGFVVPWLLLLAIPALLIWWLVRRRGDLTKKASDAS